MGYVIGMKESTISISLENANKIMNVLKKYIEEKNPDWRWINCQYLKECCERYHFDEVMEELRYAIVVQDGSYKIDYFVGEKLGEDIEIFNVISPFIDDGYIEMYGEDGDRWRWIFKKGKVETRYPKVEWES